MLKRLFFAITHPVHVWRYLERERSRQKIRRQVRFGQKVRPVLGQIESVAFFSPQNIKTFPYIKMADQVLAGRLCLYAGLPVRPGKKINWHRDYLSHFVWPKNKFSLAIAYDYPRGTDIKNAWEVSRSQQLLIVGLAYQQTRDEKYARYVVEVIDDWIDNNPYYFGVNWKVAMEVGIRAANWLMAYNLVKDSTALSKKFQARFLGSLNQHGQFINDNLEFFGVKSNHYFSDLVGLIWIGLLCPDLPNAARWQRFGIREFEQEILHQFHADGLNFEGSLPYHRLVLEMALYTSWLLRLKGQALSKAAFNRLEKATRVFDQLSINGQFAQVGDNDSGRFFVINYFNSLPTDGRYLPTLANLAIGSRLPETSNDEFWWVQKNSAEQAKWLWLPQSKIGVWRAHDWQLLVSCPPIGQDGNGGHNHDDNGSFELSFKNQPIVVDPGTGTYTANPHRRNFFRSALAHNAPVVPGLVSQPPDLLFVGRNYQKAELVEQTAQRLELTVHAERYTCQRKIFLGQTVRIEDSTFQPQPLQVTLTLPPGTRLQAQANGVKIGAKVILTTTNKIQLVRGWYSPHYQKIVRTTMIRLSSDDGRLSFEFSAQSPQGRRPKTNQ